MSMRSTRPKAATLRAKRLKDDRPAASAILAADVVGHSRLMGQDEAGAALAVRESREAARPIVARP